MNAIARLKATRRYMTGVLVNLPISTTETTIATFLTMLDHFAENPDDYYEFINED